MCFNKCQGSEDEHNWSCVLLICFWSVHATGTAGRLSSEDVACVWRACQGVSNEADGFNSSLQLDCDFTMWRGLKATLITEHDKVREQECCVLCAGWQIDKFNTNVNFYLVYCFSFPFLISSASFFLRPHSSASPGVYSVPAIHFLLEDLHQHFVFGPQKDVRCK